MDMRLEVVPLPVSDIDRAKEFYVERVGFTLDHDVRPAEGVRVVQLTPQGSSCSIILGAGLPGLSTDAGSTRGLHLVVDDIDAFTAALSSRGVDAGEITDLGGGIRVAGFADPDGNTWVLQEIGVS